MVGMNPLIDIVPEKYRKLVYFLVTLLVGAYGVFQATDGNWGQVVGSVLVALTTGVATANTAVVTDDLPDDPYDGDYEAAVTEADEAADNAEPKGQTERTSFVVDPDGNVTDVR
jgi:hypothetical protein